jgi:adenylate cyclase
VKDSFIPEEGENKEWLALLTGEKRSLFTDRRLFRALPSAPRCKLCNSPFGGPVGFVFRRIGKGPSTINPHFCTMCQNWAKHHRGGAEVELSMLFADVRGSTPLAEALGTSAFTRLINRFYVTATNVVVQEDGLLTRLVGDEVIALFVPGAVGDRHARVAMRAARELLRATGHGDPGGPWIPLGASVHTGRAYVGFVGEGTITDFTALGDEVNVAARLAAAAGPGEILVSATARDASGLQTDGLDQRHLALKGKSEPADVWVLTVNDRVGAEAS